MDSANLCGVATLPELKGAHFVYVHVESLERCH